MSNPILEAQCVTKSYPMGNSRLEVLKGVDLKIQKGEAVCIVGSSGADKSTLLHILGTLDQPTLGKVFFKGTDLTRKDESATARFRGESMGFVFQFHYLLNEFRVLENVMLPGLKLGKLPEAQVRERAMDRLETLGIKSLADKKANQLSGGEKQRVAIARALINDPDIIMCDEPTGNLDKANSLIVFDIFKELTEKQGQTLLVVTHDQEFANNTHRIIEMEDGRIVSH